MCHSDGRGAQWAWGDREPIWRQRRALLGLLARAPRRWRLALWVCVGLAGVLPAGFAVGVGVLVSRVPGAVGTGLDSPEGRGVLVALAGIAVLLVLERLVAPVLDVVRYRIGRDIDGSLREELLEAADAQPLLSVLEGEQVQNQISLVGGGLFGTAGTAATAAAGIVGRYLQAALSLAVIAWFSVPLAATVGVIVVAIRRRWHKAFSALADGLLESAGDLRKETYVAELATTPPAAKEVRIFGLVDWLIARSRGYWVSAVAVPFEVRGRLRRSARVELTLLGGSYVLTSVFAARAAARGDLGLGLLAAILQAQFSAAQLIAPTGDDFSTGPGYAALRATGLAVEALAVADPARHGDAEVPPLVGAIELDGVSFTYPGGQQPVLHDLHLRVERGEALAIVGLNGAGKTTLVKLLCGLYRPTAGVVRVDGVPLEHLDQDAWRRQIAVIFQDFVRYELSAADNIRLVNSDAAASDPEIRAAADAAGALGFLDALPQGFDTVLSRQYPRRGGSLRWAVAARGARTCSARRAIGRDGAGAGRADRQPRRPSGG
jgi:ATP-binding cassette, subfamily B, bacterial